MLVPLAITWLVGNIGSAGVAYHFTQRAYDRSLLQDALLLANSVQEEDGRLVLELTPREVGQVLYDQVESQYFSVVRADGAAVAGNQRLDLEPPEAEEPYRYQEVHVGNRALRAISLKRDYPQPFTVHVAETTSSRDDTLRRLAWYALLPELLLLLLLGAWLRRNIRQELQPLAQLQEGVGQRHANDLAPVDVTSTSREVAALAGALNALLARLEQSVRAQREFAGNVAHELRTPLAGIRALADYGLAREDPAAWREQLLRIAASEARASHLVDQLLELALALEAQAGLRLEPVALDELVRSAVLRFLPRADAAGVDLGAVGIDRPCSVRADPTLVEGILNNLLDNALRYGAATDGQSSTVTVLVERRPEAVVLSVLDNGPGLPGEVQAQLVQRGAQGETGQLLAQGAGLGLALVSQYATLLQARMALGRGPGGRGWLCTITFGESPPG